MGQRQEGSVAAQADGLEESSSRLTGGVQPCCLSEIRRLLRRKSELLALGYDRADPLIQRIEHRVADLANGGVGEGGGGSSSYC